MKGAASPLTFPGAPASSPAQSVTHNPDHGPDGSPLQGRGGQQLIPSTGASAGLRLAGRRTSGMRGSHCAARAVAVQPAAACLREWSSCPGPVPSRPSTYAKGQLGTLTAHSGQARSLIFLWNSQWVNKVIFLPSQQGPCRSLKECLLSYCHACPKARGPHRCTKGWGFDSPLLASWPAATRRPWVMLPASLHRKRVSLCC